MNSYKDIIINGLWHNNQALVAMLGLCPMLAVTNTAINGIGLGLATILVLFLSNVTVSVIRNLVPSEVRLPIFVLVIASFVTAVELMMSAWFYDLYKILGIFIPLIVTNCAIIGRAEAFASKNSVFPAAIDGLAMGFGFLVVLFILGATREAIGQGTLFSQAHLMFGEVARNWLIHVPDYQGVLLAILPPGAFMGLGTIIVIKNIVDDYLAKKKKPLVEPLVPAEST